MNNIDNPLVALTTLYEYAIRQAESDMDSSDGNEDITGIIDHCFSVVDESLLNWEKGSTPDEDGEYFLFGKNINDNDCICFGHYYNSEWIIAEGLKEIYKYAKVKIPTFDNEKEGENSK